MKTYGNYGALSLDLATLEQWASDDLIAPNIVIGRSHVRELVAHIRELEAEHADLVALEAFLLRDGSAALVLSNDAGNIAWELLMDELSIISNAADLPAALRGIREAMARLGEVTE